MTRLYLVTWQTEQYHRETAHIVAESMGEAVNIWRVISQNDGEPEGVKLQLANVYEAGDKPGAFDGAGPLGPMVCD